MKFLFALLLSLSVHADSVRLGAGNALFLHGRPIATTAPTNGQVLTWSSATGKWAPAAAGGGDLLADGTVPLTAHWDVGAFNITASSFIGALTGNASTATALAANPAACDSGDFVTDIAANGTLTCDTPAGGSEVETSPTKQNFASTPAQVGWMFTISSGSATVGATYTNNSNTYTVVATVSGATQIWMSGTGATSGGTLTKASGTGDATLTFSAKVAYGTYTTPANVKWILVRAMGGGGGAAGSATLNGNIGDGSAGGSSIFGAGTLIATGGAGGGHSIGTASTGGTCSAGPNGYIGLTGGNGQGTLNVSDNATVGSWGGAAAGPFGGIPGMPGAPGNNAAPDAPSNSGAGGGSSGPAVNPILSGAGGAGGGYCEVIISSPSATYPVIVGAAGARGSNGSGGTVNGGNGGSGYLSVEEHYNY